MTLAVVSSHPIQYHAPVYRALQADFGVPVTAIYGSDFSVAGYHDREFGVNFAWDTDLLSGYDSIFLSQVAAGGARSVEEVTTHGLGSALRQIRPRAVLLIGYSLPMYRAAFWYAQRLRLPVLFRAEVTDLSASRSLFKSILRDQSLRLFYRRCAALMYIGKNARAHFRRLGCPDKKLFFSPYCVDTAPFQLGEAVRGQLRSTTRAALELSDDRQVLLFCGKLAPHKGPDLALHAIKRLPHKVREQVTLAFLGDGEMRDRLQDLAAADPWVDVRFLGFQNQQRLSQYYHAADLLVLSSHGETWGLVVNEALLHGLPCIVSDAVGCAPDLIRPGVTGEIFRAGQIDDLSQAMIRILQTPNDALRRARCRQQVESYMTEGAAEGLARAYAFSTRDHVGDVRSTREQSS